MAARKKKSNAIAPIGDLLALMQQAAPAAPIVAPVPEPEVVTEPVAQAKEQEFHWSRVDVAAPPAAGAVVRVDGQQLMVYRQLHLVYERRSGKHASISIPRDYALLVAYPDAGALAPMHTIALDRIEVRGEEVKDA